MSKEVVVKVHGKYDTYEIVKEVSVWSTKYGVYKDGSCKRTFSSRTNAVREAHKLAGPNAYEG
jgi:hypothetical protein